MGIDFEIMKKITKLVPEMFGKTTNMTETVKVSQIKPYVEQYPDLFKHAKELEGCVNSFSIHHSAIIISRDSIQDDVPLCNPTKTSDLAVAFDMNDAEIMGLVKLDVLGLTELDIIEEAMRLIKERH